MKVGALAFAPVGRSLAGPSWRQALIFKKLEADRWLLVLRVQSSTPEQEGCFQHEGRMFAVVESSSASLKKACVELFLALEVDTASLQSRAASFLDDHHDLVFTTASEEVKPTSAAARAPPGRPVEPGPDSDSYSSEEGAADLLEQVKSLRKSWQGRASPDDESSSDDDKTGFLRANPDKKTKKFVLLESKHRKGKSRGGKEEKLLQKLAGSSDSNPLKALATVELLKKFRGKTKKKSRGSSSSSASARSSRSSSLESRRGHKATGVAKAVSNLRSWKRGLRRHPLRHVRRYVKQVEHDLGATDGAPYRLTDHGKRLAWNRQKSLQRVYHLVGAILEKQLRGHPDQAAMLTVQSLRAVHQVVIDEGNWSVAWLLTGLEDPFARRRFGGEEESLETIAAFLKASQDLERRTKSWNLGSDNGQAQPPESAEVDTKGKGPKGGKGRGRNQDPAKADA